VQSVCKKTSVLIARIALMLLRFDIRAWNKTEVHRASTSFYKLAVSMNASMPDIRQKVVIKAKHQLPTELLVMANLTLLRSQESGNRVGDAIRGDKLGGEVLKALLPMEKILRMFERASSLLSKESRR